MALFNRQEKKAGKAAPEPEAQEVAAKPADPPEQAPDESLAAVEPAPARPAEEQPTSGSPEPASLGHEISEGATTEQHETLPAALEPELRRIIDTAVARVAAIELDAIRQSRALTLRTEEEGREALKYALDRALELVKSFELLTVTIAGMVDALRVELDETMEALQAVQEPQSELSRELDARKAAAAETAPAIEPPVTVVEPEPEPQPEPEPEPEPEPKPESRPEPAPVQAAPPSMNGAEVEPSPEMEEMFRERIRSMKESGKNRQEAERSLLRFNLGRRYLPLLDEIYGEASAQHHANGGQRKGRVRSFFTR